MRRGFTLVELSIVLVILGLLTGGILAGQSLIRAAELRKTMNYVSETRTAWMSFKDKYFALPGDMTNATSFWGRSNLVTDWHASGTCPSQPGTASASGTCNGDGDGYMATNPEQNGMWEHLQLAGLIGYPVNTEIAWNTQPPGLRKGIYAVVLNNGCCAGAAKSAMDFWFGNPQPNGVLVTGVGLRLGTYGDPFYDVIGGVLSPQELWQMDTKMDDGLPGSGMSYGFNGTNGMAGAWNTTCLTASGGSYVYNLSETDTVCQALFVLERR